MKQTLLAAAFCSIAFLGGCKTIGEFLARPTADTTDDPEQTVGDQAVDEAVDWITLAFGAGAGMLATMGGKVAKSKMKEAREKEAEEAAKKAAAKA